MLRIGQLAGRTGASTHLLRVWEDRYSLLTPRRSGNGYRLYSPEDERRVREMQRLRASGVAAAEAAALILATTAPAAAPDTLDHLLERLVAAFDEFDDATAHAVLDEVLGAHDLEAALDEVVFPALRHLGAEWVAGRLSIAHEHYASTLLRGRLLGLTRDLEQGRADTPRPLAVLACATYERHDIGLLAVGLVLRRDGWRVSFLGADTPVPEVVALATQLRATAVVLSGTEPRMFAAQLEHHADDLATLTGTLALGGAAATPEVAARYSALHLDGTPGDASRLITAELGRSARALTR